MILREWLPDILQQIDTYVSSEDIRKGNRWALEIAKELESSDHGIVCLAPDNLDAPWIHFEAGALTKSVQASFLWTLLIGVSTTDVEGPLAQFQHTTLEREDIFRLVTTMNSQLGDARLDDSRIERVFAKFWPEFEQKTKEAIRNVPKGAVAPPRTEKALLEELLEITRSTSRLMTDFAPIDGDNPPKRYNFRTSVTIVPGQSEQVVNAFQERVRADSKIRMYGIVAHGAGGIGLDGGGMETGDIWIQSHRPMPKRRLLELAAEVGLEVIDVTYSRFVFT